MSNTEPNPASIGASDGVPDAPIPAEAKRPSSHRSNTYMAAAEAFLIVSQPSSVPSHSWRLPTDFILASATTIGAASASGITSKHQAWNSSPHDLLFALPYKFYALNSF